MGADSGEQEFISGASTVSTTGKGDLNRDWWNEQPTSGRTHVELQDLNFILLILSRISTNTL